MSAMTGATNTPTDPWAALGLPGRCSADVLAAAWRRAAMRTHPDRPGGSSEAFRAVSAAHEACLTELARPASEEPYEPHGEPDEWLAEPDDWPEPAEPAGGQGPSPPASARERSWRRWLARRFRGEAIGATRVLLGLLAGLVALRGGVVAGGAVGVWAGVGTAGGVLAGWRWARSRWWIRGWGWRLGWLAVAAGALHALR